jgi:diadenosine tetraphosphate (Ap4A) HIT family hydrolase
MSTAWTLWEDARFAVTTSANPHMPPEEGCHLVVAPKVPPPHAWADPGVTAATFELAARVSGVLVRLGIVHWVKRHAHGNWGLLPGITPHVHVHVYGRRRDGETWVQPG